MMEQALRAAGFARVETVDGVICARSTAVLPEFTATRMGAGWQLSFAWPLRASPAQCAEWTAAHPIAPMDIHHGETRITLLASPETLPLWRDLMDAMVSNCTAWRRATRQRDEGM